jgi:hypothetical protein
MWMFDGSWAIAVRENCRGYLVPVRWTAVPPVDFQRTCHLGGRPPTPPAIGGFCCP